MRGKKSALELNTIKVNERSCIKTFIDKLTITKYEEIVVVSSSLEAFKARLNGI